MAAKTRVIIPAPVAHGPCMCRKMDDEEGIYTAKAELYFGASGKEYDIMC